MNERFTGVVKYVGDLDSSYTHDQLFVGVKLDEPGENVYKCISVEHIPLKHRLYSFACLQLESMTVHSMASASSNVLTCME